MGLRHRLTKTELLSHLPRRTVRLRLTLVYGVLFLASGALILLITDALWGQATKDQGTVSGDVVRGIAVNLPLRPPSGSQSFTAAGTLAPKGTLAQLGVTARQQRVVGNQLLSIKAQQHTSDLHQLILYSALAVIIMAILAVVLGWLMSGRVLRPLRTITMAARDISDTNLHQRVRLDGPDDELKELGDTFDGLLERLEGSFDCQRQFAANASHELRTPMAIMRATIDVALAKPGPVPESTVALADKLRQELDHVDRLLDGLLALARAQRGPTDDAPISLHDLAAAAIARRGAVIAQAGLDVDLAEFAGAMVAGSETLLGRMVENVIENAVTHNEEAGWIRVSARSSIDPEGEGGWVRLSVENGGPVLDERTVEGLVQPFRRLGAERTGSEAGSGLGLSIVAAVVKAHGGHLELHARDGGGLAVVMALPVAVRQPAGASA
ncbi:MAG TPA: HAMP domain-containing sensor histidine kinase [Acidimicrobiales bacterium]|jgi:hypothetical protein